jgi:RNA polymerase sigma-70 factor (ECF subfamily)
VTDSLTERLRAGDESAFDELFREWYAPLVRVARGIVRSKAIAEEVVQEAMLELWRHRERLDADGSVQAYIMRSTKNRALNYVRHERVRDRAAPLLSLEQGHATRAMDDVVGEEIGRAARQAVAALPERTREVFELSRVTGLKYAEIAESLGISIKTVEAQMGRALRHLREQLAPWLPGGDRL